MDQENGKAEFRRSFRGYNVDEVDEFVENAEKDIDSLRGEVSELCKKLTAANEEIEKYHREEAVRGDIIKDAKKNADDILADAKGRAARVIIRTSRQCNRIVADMVSQVEEQKSIYESTKSEVLKFRRDLFSMYKDHILKINAYSEAAGVFETDALSKSELDSFIKLLGEDPGVDIDDDPAPSYVGSQVEEEVERIKRNASESAREILKERENAVFADDPGDKDVTFEEAGAEEEYGETAEEYGAPEGQYPDEEPEEENSVPNNYFTDLSAENDVPGEAGENFDLNGVIDNVPREEDDFEFVPGALGEEDPEEFETPEISLTDDPEEFGSEGEIKNTVKEYDGPVSVNTVFDKLNTYKGPDFEAIYGGTDPDSEKEEESGPTEEELLERRRRAEDDSNEFYSAEDIEFDPLADPDSPTSETGPMFDTVEKPKSMKRRWKIKRRMSITDEFKAIKSDDDND